jgi:hypothetical protein
VRAYLVRDTSLDNTGTAEFHQSLEAVDDSGLVEQTDSMDMQKHIGRGLCAVWQ